MDQIKESINFNQVIQIDLLNFASSLLVAIILSFFVQITYNRTSKTLSNQNNFSRIFILLCLTTTIIITIIKSSLALSLGLVGALSIVRFRAAIKEPEELVYLFLIIAIGLGCGAGQLKITIVGTIIAILIIYILHKASANSKKLELETFNISVVSKKKLESSEIKDTIDIIGKLSERCELVSISINSEGSSINLIVNLSDLQSITQINQEFNKNFPHLDFVLVRERKLNV